MPASNHNNPAKGSSVTELNSTAHAICACGKPIAKLFKSGKSYKRCAACRAKQVKGNERETVTTCYCGCDIPQAATGKIRRYCSARCRQRKRTADRLGVAVRTHRLFCVQCASALGAGNVHRIYCSAKCNSLAQARKAGALPRDEYLANARSPEYEVTGTRQRGRRVALLKAATVEKVDPFAVFDRDGWRCRICERATPKEKRGSYDDDAPELDHIIPLSKGGEHSYRNTQCTCRKCNAIKSDSAGRQMLLAG